MIIASSDISEEVTVKLGVPQGSVLRLILLIKIIDSVADIDILSTSRIFAVDSHFMREVSSEEYALEILNDLEKFYLYMSRQKNVLYWRQILMPEDKLKET